MSESQWWTSVSGKDLAQGDLLSGCLFPEFEKAPVPQEDGSPVEVNVNKGDLIIISQSCDLEQGKLKFVAACPIIALEQFAAVNEAYANTANGKGRRENIRKGRVASYHLVASPIAPENNQEALVVDFGQIISLPFGYVATHAESVGDRWRLNSPFLEHFSQALARFFMRVGLPSSIAPYR
jgi:hypothetical protein